MVFRKFAYSHITFFMFTAAVIGLSGSLEPGPTSQAQAIPPGIAAQQGLYLTSLSQVTAAGDALYTQLWHYDDDGILDPGEEILDDWVCPTPYRLAETQEAGCTPYSEYDFLYANHDYDLAILRLETERQALRLNAVPLQIGDSVIIGDSFATIQQTAPLTVAILPAPQGTPVYNMDGEAVGFVSHVSGDGLSISAVSDWIDALRDANQSMKSGDLDVLLSEAVSPLTVDGAETIGDAFAPELGNGGIDVQHYALDLGVDMEPPFIDGTAGLTIRAIQHNLSSFTLDIRQMQVTEVSFEGRPAEFLQTDRKVRIFLSAPQPFGETFVVQLKYRGLVKAISSPYLPNFPNGALIDTESPRLAFVTEPDAANTWFPSNDHPLDPATFYFRITVKEPYDAVANGKPLAFNLNPEGSRSFVYLMNYPMATYLAIIAVADYEMIVGDTDSLPITHYVYSGSDLDNMAALFSATPLALRTLTGLFGPYPYDTYGHVIVPMAGGAMETQTISAMPYTLSRRSREESIWSLVVHELAHQWTGNYVRLGTWKDIWLNEGFATYSEWLADERRYGQPQALRLREAAESAVIRSSRTTPLAFPLQREMFSRDSYDKGAWVLHMLRQNLGDEIFFPMLLDYTITFGNLTVTTEAFFQFVERYSRRDLTQFRHQWLDQSGIPKYTLYWNATGRSMRLKLCSEAPENRYEITIPLIFADQNSRQSVAIPVSPNQIDVELSLNLDFAPQSLSVDPDQTLLASIVPGQTSVIPDCERS